ncbi:cupin domain-containing protein [Streptomyces gamaensis]|uniref:Cupin domain-containing protein n=1 Tax=Streptomyces gamaensis TaxID=1763542 RepID=A0ABW0Z7Q3_9ACTN
METKQTPVVDVAGLAGKLPAVWRTHVLGEVGGARIKVLRMDETPHEGEAHERTEALFVLEGRMELTYDGTDVTVRAGEICVVPAGTYHTVRAGSSGVLVIIDAIAGA